MILKDLWSNCLWSSPKLHSLARYLPKHITIHTHSPQKCIFKLMHCLSLSLYPSLFSLSLFLSPSLFLQHITIKPLCFAFFLFLKVCVLLKAPFVSVSMVKSSVFVFTLHDDFFGRSSRSLCLFPFVLFLNDCHFIPLNTTMYRTVWSKASYRKSVIITPEGGEKNKGGTEERGEEGE